MITAAPSCPCVVVRCLLFFISLLVCMTYQPKQATAVCTVYIERAERVRVYNVESFLSVVLPL